MVVLLVVKILVKVGELPKTGPVKFLSHKLVYTNPPAMYHLEFKVVLLILDLAVGFCSGLLLL